MYSSEWRWDAAAFKTHRDSRGRRSEGGKSERGSETPLGAAFRCRDRPTAEYCRRAVVMETERQSRLFTGLHKITPPFPCPPPPPRRLFPPSLSLFYDRKSEFKPAGLLPVDEDRTGSSGTQEVTSPETRLRKLSALPRVKDHVTQHRKTSSCCFSAQFWFIYH